MPLPWSPETDSYRIWRLGKALTALANRMDPLAAAEIAKGLAAALEPQEPDFYRVSSLGEALAALADRMDPLAAAEVASRGAQRLAATLENPQKTAQEIASIMENPEQTPINPLSPLDEPLAALAKRMEPQVAAEIARRGAQRVAAALGNLQKPRLQPASIPW